MQARVMSSTVAPIRRKVAVILSGCGVYDGSEIHETSAVLAHLSLNGVEPVMYAPDVDQMHVINHTKGEPHANEKRNVLIESARIARGNIENVNNLKIGDVDAVVFPGGFGVAKNLSTFATEGPNCKVDAGIERILKEFHAAKKPIGLCCIAPVLAAKVLPGVKLTLGQDKDDGSGSWPYADAAQAAVTMGANHQNCNVDEIVIDEKNMTVTTPAFMYGAAKFHEIYDGIGNMVTALMKMAKS